MTPNIHTIIRQHVSLEVRCIDRVYLHAYPMVMSGVRAMSKRPICLAARLPVTPACPYVRT